MMARTDKCPVPVYQDPGELEQLLEIYRSLKPRRVLEIGSLYGGTLWHWIANAQPGASIVSVDLLPGEDNEWHPPKTVMDTKRLWSRWARDARVRLVTIKGRSDSIHVLGQARRLAPYDFIFVDGGHDYETVSKDFYLYWPLLREQGVMAFHDIAYPDDNPVCIDVGRWWREMEAEGAYQMESFTYCTDPDWWGIGVIRK